MTEQERYTIEKDVINEKLCIWDYDDLICEIDDDKTLTTLVNLLNKLHKENIKLKTANQRWEKICCEGLQINDTLRKNNQKLNEELDEYGKSL